MELTLIDGESNTEYKLTVDREKATNGKSEYKILRKGVESSQYLYKSSGVYITFILQIYNLQQHYYDMLLKVLQRMYRKKMRIHKILNC